MPKTPSIVPYGADQTIYIIVDSFGGSSIGKLRSFHPTAATEPLHHFAFAMVGKGLHVIKPKEKTGGPLRCATPRNYRLSIRIGPGVVDRGPSHEICGHHVSLGFNALRNRHLRPNSVTLKSGSETGRR
jgi:hypothetical protein